MRTLFVSNLFLPYPRENSNCSSIQQLRRVVRHDRWKKPLFLLPFICNNPGFVWSRLHLLSSSSSSSSSSTQFLFIFKCQLHEHVRFYRKYVGSLIFLYFNYSFRRRISIRLHSLWTPLSVIRWNDAIFLVLKLMNLRYFNIYWPLVVESWKIWLKKYVKIIFSVNS